MSKKTIDLKKEANAILKKYPGENKVFMTPDGQGFFAENSAKNHAESRKLEDPEVFFREGHSNEIDSDVEALLQVTEEEKSVLQQVVDKVIDISNVEAEENPNVSDKDHDAVKSVFDLRQRLVEAEDTTLKIKNELSEKTTEAVTAKSALESKEGELETVSNVLQSVKKQLADKTNKASKLTGELNKLKKQLPKKS